MQRMGSAMPVEVIGLNGTPTAGDELPVVLPESRARGEISEFRMRRRRAWPGHPAALNA